ncbi:hypothetical protein D3C77_498470 [compost metagenome]
MEQRWAKRHVPRRGGEPVAVALGKAIGRRGIVRGEVFQYLGLLAFVQHLGEQPELVPFSARMLADGEEMAAEQPRLIALPPGLPGVAAVAFQGALAEVFAALAVNEAAGIAIVLKGRAGLVSGDSFQS